MKIFKISIAVFLIILAFVLGIIANNGLAKSVEFHQLFIFLSFTVFLIGMRILITIKKK